MSFASSYIKEVNMVVIFMDKRNFGVDQYENVTNIAYNATTKIYTITYGSGSTTSYDGNNFTLSVLMK